MCECVCYAVEIASFGASIVDFSLYIGTSDASIVMGRCRLAMCTGLLKMLNE